jgi:putative hydroxymethylpyrimidine transport system permease protein
MKKLIKKNGFYSIVGLISIPVIMVLIAYFLKYVVFGIGVFPSPITIFKTTFLELLHAEVRKAIWYTISNVLLASSCAFVLGVLLGFIISRKDNIWLISQPGIDFFRSIPVTFIIPLAALLLGGSSSKSIIPFLTFYPAFLIMLIQVRSGVAKQNPERLHSFIVINGGNSKWATFWHVTFFESLPEIITGLRITITYCLVIVTVLEYSSFGPMGNRKGLGYLIFELVNNSDFSNPRIYAYTFLVGLLGFSMNKFIEMYQYKLIHWVKPKN